MSTLHLAIRARLVAALDEQDAMGGSPPEASSGLATGGPNHPVLRLSLDDVVVLVSIAVEQWVDDQLAQKPSR